MRGLEVRASIEKSPAAPAASADTADQILDLARVRAEIGRHLVEVRIGHLLEARLVDVADDLDTNRLELGSGLVLERDRLGGLVPVDLVGGGQHPALLFGRKAVP